MISLPVKQSDQKLGLFMKTINNLHKILKEHKKKHAQMHPHTPPPQQKFAQVTH